MRPLLVLVLACSTQAACVAHSTTMRDVRDALVHDDLEGARARLADAGKGTDDLLFALEDGMLLHYLGDYGLSNQRFEFAEMEIEDLYTRSISRAVLSMVTSDAVLEWRPYGVEPLMINYYRALNYIGLGEPEEARVEWRKIAQRLQFRRAEADELGPYVSPPFFDYLAGLGLEADDPNAAYVSLRIAEREYRRQRVAPPAGLIHDLMRLAARLGFRDHLERYRARYGDEESVAAGSGLDVRYPTSDIQGPTAGVSPAQDEPRGEVVVLVEDGLVAPIHDVRAYIPITRTRARRIAPHGDREDENEDEHERHEEELAEARLELAETLAREYRAGRYSGVGPGYASKVEIAYVLPLALPVFGTGEHAFHQVEVGAGAWRDRPAADSTGNGTPDSLRLSVAVPGRVALNISALQRRSFQDRLAGIQVKTIARALAKYAASAALSNEAEDEGGDTAGTITRVLTNAVNIATERADTRAWLGLPHRIWMARLSLPAGRYGLELRLDGVDVPLGPVEVGPGERRFVAHRVF